MTATANGNGHNWYSNLGFVISTGVRTPDIKSKRLSFNPSHRSWTDPIKNICSVIFSIHLVENGHMTWSSQSQCLNFSIELIDAENFFIGFGPVFLFVNIKRKLLIVKECLAVLKNDFYCQI